MTLLQSNFDRGSSCKVPSVLGGPGTPIIDSAIYLHHLFAPYICLLLGSEGLSVQYCVELGLLLTLKAIYTCCVTYASHCLLLVSGDHFFIYSIIPNVPE